MSPCLPTQATGPQRLIVGLDLDSADAAMAVVNQLGPACNFYKVGLQLLTAAGPDLVRQLVSQGKHVFLDLKLFEIPNSVASAVREAGRLGVAMVTVHAMGGSAVLRAAVQAAKPFGHLKVFALTVITSLQDTDLAEIGVNASVDAQVRRLALLAQAAGCDGVIASAREAALLRQSLGPHMLIVTPGVQLPGAAANDQVRVADPGQAVAQGANYVVMSRAIVQAADPVAAFKRACQLIETAKPT